MQAHVRALFAALSLVLLAAAVRGDDPELLVGFGRADLTTEQKRVSLAGYGGRGLLPHKGVHDATLVKVMVVRTPERAVALVTSDLIGVQRHLLEALGERGFPDRVGLTADDVLFSASHTHAGYGCLAQKTESPLLNALFIVSCGPYRQPFFDEVLGKIHAAIVAAWDDLAPAKIGVGSEEVAGLSRNRGVPGGVTDPELGVIKITDPEGALRGLVVNFAAHPTILGADNRLASGGWPGALQRALEERYEGISALFTNGAEGDQSVRVPSGDWADDWARVDATGAVFADHVARIQEGIDVRGDVRVDTQGGEFEFPEPGAGLKSSLFRNLVIGDALLMGIPGEPCAQIGLDLKRAAIERGFGKAFVIGLAQDHCGYFVHAEDYAPEREALQEYAKKLNPYGPGVGAFFHEVLLERLAPEPLGR